MTEARNARWTQIGIADEVVIESSAKLVTGFVATDMLRILPRSEPLDIVGTFLVAVPNISEAAVKAGINWYSVYHYAAIKKLRDAKRLGFGHDCKSLFESPERGAQVSLLAPLGISGRDRGASFLLSERDRGPVPQPVCFGHAPRAEHCPTACKPVCRSITSSAPFKYRRRSIYES